MPSSKPETPRDIVAADAVGGAKSLVDRLDVSDPEHHRRLMAQLTDKHHAVELALTMPVQEAAERAGVDRSQLLRLVEERALYAIGVDGRDRLPRWQFSAAGGILPGVGVLVPAIPDRYPIELIDTYLRLPHENCDNLSPLTYLTTGGDPRVVARLISQFDRW